MTHDKPSQKPNAGAPVGCVFWDMRQGECDLGTDCKCVLGQDENIVYFKPKGQDDG